MLQSLWFFFCSLVLYGVVANEVMPCNAIVSITPPLYYKNFFLKKTQFKSFTSSRVDGDFINILATLFILPILHIFPFLVHKKGNLWLTTCIFRWLSAVGVYWKYNKVWDLKMIIFFRYLLFCIIHLFSSQLLWRL